METKMTELSAADAALRSGVRVLWGPEIDRAITPDVTIISGFIPKFSGFQRTRSASVPTATEPTMCDIP